MSKLSLKKILLEIEDFDNNRKGSWFGSIGTEREVDPADTFTRLRGQKHSGADLMHDAAILVKAAIEEVYGDEPFGRRFSKLINQLLFYVRGEQWQAFLSEIKGSRLSNYLIGALSRISPDAKEVEDQERTLSGLKDLMRVFKDALGRKSNRPQDDNQYWKDLYGLGLGLDKIPVRSGLGEMKLSLKKILLEMPGQEGLAQADLSKKYLLAAEQYIRAQAARAERLRKAYRHLNKEYRDYHEKAHEQGYLPDDFDKESEMDYNEFEDLARETYSERIEHIFFRPYFDFIRNPKIKKAISLIARWARSQESTTLAALESEIHDWFEDALREYLAYKKTDAAVKYRQLAWPQLLGDVIQDLHNFLNQFDQLLDARPDLADLHVRTGDDPTPRWSDNNDAIHDLSRQAHGSNYRRPTSKMSMVDILKKGRQK